MSEYGASSFWTTTVDTFTTATITRGDILRAYRQIMGLDQRKSPADCPHKIDSPAGRQWIKDNCGHPTADDRAAADQRILGAGFGPARPTLPDRDPDPADPAYLDMLAEQISEREELDRHRRLEFFKATMVRGVRPFDPRDIVFTGISDR